jgi:L-amino acid N-acyltransferase YncA
MIIRDATHDDLPAILAIFNEVIKTSTAVYRDDPVPLDERRDWFDARKRGGYPVLVAEADGKVIGFSSFGEFRGAYPGYRHTVEHSVHVDKGARGTGAGTALLEALFPHAAALGKHVMIGAIDAANEGSLRFHARLGFTQTGLLPEVGFKFGRWLDPAFVQRTITRP